jgi:osmotically-inducible protein OsmY
MNPLVNPTAEKVEESIMKHEAFKVGSEISAIEKGGVVTLRGSVPSKKYLDLAEAIAQGIQGVSGVINQMEVDPSLEAQPGILDLDDETEVPPARSGPHAHG